MFFEKIGSFFGRGENRGKAIVLFVVAFVSMWVWAYIFSFVSGQPWFTFPLFVTAFITVVVPFIVGTTYMDRRD